MSDLKSILAASKARADKLKARQLVIDNNTKDAITYIIAEKELLKYTFKDHTIKDRHNDVLDYIVELFGDINKFDVSDQLSRIGFWTSRKINIISIVLSLLIVVILNAIFIFAYTTNHELSAFDITALVAFSSPVTFIIWIIISYNIQSSKRSTYKMTDISKW